LSLLIDCSFDVFCPGGMVVQRKIMSDLNSIKEHPLVSITLL
jgi:hypothetical protein